MGTSGNSLFVMIARHFRADDCKDAGDRATHDCMDAEGRATQDAKAEDAKVGGGSLCGRND